MVAMNYTYKGRSHTVELPGSAAVAEFKAAVATKHSLHVHRQGLKFVTPDGSKTVVRLSDASVPLGDYFAIFTEKFGSHTEPVIAVSDLGPQISYRLVFILEYLGPAVILLVAASRPAAVYGARAASMPWIPAAKVDVLFFLAHFVKRLYETMFVHRFSRPTMPLRNLFRNCAYYYTFAAVVSFMMASPAYSSTSSATAHTVGAALFVVCEAVNFAVHLHLRGMRPREGSTKRDPPSGPLFALVSCPNYTSEALTWVGHALMTGLFASWLFMLVGLAQMTSWALQKHGGYLKSDPSYKAKGRKAIIPFVV